MLAEPNFAEPQNAGESYICIEEEQYCAYLDHDAAVTLLHSLYWLARDSVLAEESSIYSTHWNKLPSQGKPIGYCEFNTVPSHTVKKQGKNILKVGQSSRQYVPGVYSPEADRLDYFVSIEEVTTAYEALALALQDNEDRRGSRQITLFGTLVIHLVSWLFASSAEPQSLKIQRNKFLRCGRSAKCPADMPISDSRTNLTDARVRRTLSRRLIAKDFSPL